MNTIRVGINGADGRMGRLVAHTVEHDAADMDLVLRTDVGDDLKARLHATPVDVVVDFTVPSVVFGNTMTIIESGARAVVGTTGLTADQVAAIDDAVGRAGTSAIIAPNFSLGAVLMMRLAREAAAFYRDCEIIELHHEKKVDAPSGTAKMTAREIAAAWRTEAGTQRNADAGATQPSRGMDSDGIQVHSVRLPGKMAHQEVIFGGTGETLTIRHDALSRECFAPGVLWAIRRVLEIEGLEVELAL